MTATGQFNADKYQDLIESLLRLQIEKDKVINIVKKTITQDGHEPDTDWVSEVVSDRLSVLKTAGKRHLQSELEEWISVTKGNFSVTEAQRELTGITAGTNVTNATELARERSKIRTTLSRLCKAGIIERVGRADGVYRRIETEDDDVNFLQAPTDEFPVVLPLGLSEMVSIYPSNIIIVAGSKSAGKTSFLLNCVRDNMRHNDILYLNSEMGDTEFRKRLELFNGIPLNEWRFKAKHRSENFADKIDGSRRIFIIDFLEVIENAYLVGIQISQIHKKLKDGICIIGLQKPYGRDEGSGGRFSMEKSRLYLALDWVPEKKMNRIKVVDCKAWKSQSPRGKYRHFHINHGAELQEKSYWMEEGK